MRLRKLLLFTGIILMSKSTPGNSVDTTECYVGQIEGFYGANCSDRNIRDLPTTLPPDIEYLDASYLNFTELKKATFAPVKNLVVLKLTEIYPIGFVTKDTFLALEKLEYLDLSYTGKLHRDPSFNFMWPSTIKTLILDSSWIRKILRVEEIVALEELSARNLDLIDIPTFHRLAPINSLDLEANQMNEFNVEDVAPYCLLHTVLIRYKISISSKLPHTELVSKSRACQCTRLEIWANYLNITGLSPLNCSKPLPNSCSYDFEALKAMRNECLARYAKKSFLLYIIVGVIIGLLSITVCGLVAFLAYSRMKQQQPTSAPVLMSGPLKPPPIESDSLEESEVGYDENEETEDLSEEAQQEEEVEEEQ